jgi:two-component system alkaline phosphatase synthesis response regulator PhoP
VEKFKKILIIEDEEAFLKALSFELEGEGVNVITAKDGKEGLNTALKEHPDLIFLDVNLPLMNGITVLKTLRKDTWGEKALVILLTEVENPAVVAEALENGVSKYFIKSDHTIADIIDKTRKYFADLSS